VSLISCTCHRRQSTSDVRPCPWPWHAGRLLSLALAVRVFVSCRLVNITSLYKVVYLAFCQGGQSVPPFRPSIFFPSLPLFLPPLSLPISPLSLRFLSQVSGERSECTVVRAINADIFWNLIWNMVHFDAFWWRTYGSPVSNFVNERMHKGIIFVSTGGLGGQGSTLLLYRTGNVRSSVCRLLA